MARTTDLLHPIAAELEPEPESEPVAESPPPPLDIEHLLLQWHALSIDSHASVFPDWTA